jgi:hypothetical protein
MTPRWLRAGAILFAIAGVIVVGNLLGTQTAGLLDLEVTPRNEHVVHRLVMIAAAVYTFLIALPFVPGVEIALSLIMIFGAKIVVLMYFCTLAGLALAFTAGRLVPVPVSQKFLADLGLRRAAAFLGRIAEMSETERLGLMISSMPGRWAPLLLRHRYLALALALNIPGNSLIGGGGGIVLLAGISRLFSPGAFLATLAVAISPVPLAVLVFGADILPN